MECMKYDAVWVYGVWLYDIQRARGYDTLVYDCCMGHTAVIHHVYSRLLYECMTDLIHCPRVHNGSRRAGGREPGCGSG